MNRARSLLALVAAIPLVAACGSGAAGSPLTSGGSSAAHHPAATTNPANLVLHLPDVGYGYLQVDTQTESVPLAEELKGDSARFRAADRAGYRAGYRTLFANASRDGVLSEALEYTSTSAAATVYRDPYGMRKVTAEMHGRRLDLPANAPGTAGILIGGRLPDGGDLQPAYVMTWRHGTVLSMILLFGHHASPAHIVALAEKQDRRIVSFGL